MKMSTIGLIIAGGTIAYTTLFTPAPTFRKTAMNLFVHDDKGVPVEGVDVVYYHTHWIAGSPLIRAFQFIPKLRNRETFIVKEHVVTDAGGKGKMQFRTGEPMNPTLTFAKEGWYKSKKTMVYSEVRKGLYLPYPVKVDVTMKRIKNPIMLGMGTTEYIKYPINDNIFLGFDLLKNDWMPPMGNGETEDILIKASKFDPMGPNSLRSLLEITFKGNDNGIQGIPEQLISHESQFPLPYLAFDDGYTNSVVVKSFYRWSTSDKNNESNLNFDYFVFRIRVQANEKGEVMSALYGVIYGNTAVSGGNKYLSIKLPYRINETPNDRNIELAKDEYGRFILGQKALDGL